MVGLTSKQKRVLRFIQESYRLNGKEPPYREIADFMEVTVRAAAQHVEALEKKGYITRKRGIVLKEEHRPPRGIPVLGRVAAGRPILAEENIDEYLDPEDLFEAAASGDRVFALRVRGDSMTGAGILEGDVLLVCPVVAEGGGRSSGEGGDASRAPWADKIVVAVLGDDATVKTYRERVATKGEGPGTRQDSTRQDSTRQDSTRQDSTRQDGDEFGEGSEGSRRTSARGAYLESSPPPGCEGMQEYQPIDVSGVPDFRLAGVVVACYRRI